jgi:hypothetical protein
MSKIQIVSRYNSDTVLFECDAPKGLESGLYMRHALEKATAARKDLSGANLSGANLSGANLSGANLSGANLSGGLKLAGTRPYFAIGPIGSRYDSLVAYITEKGLRLQAGCFFGTRDEFVAKLDAEHGDNEHGKEYRAALVMVDAHVSIWTQAVEAEVQS